MRCRDLGATVRFSVKEILYSLPEILDFAVKQILSTKVFRAGTNEHGSIPVEFYALQYLGQSSLENERFKQLFIDASKVGKLYLAACFPERFLSDLELSTFPDLIPFLPDNGVLFQTAPPRRIFEEYIESGKLAQTIQTLLPDGAAVQTL